jgi:hypothetical protein
MPNDVVWEREEAESSSEMNVSLSGALQAVEKKVAGALMDGALRANPLQGEMTAVIEKRKRTIPPDPVAEANIPE